MAVGMVVDEALTQPEDPIETEVCLEPVLHLGLAQVRVAVGIEDALFGGHGQAGAVDVDRAAFQDPVVAADVEAGPLGEGAADPVIVVEHILPAPAIEAEQGRLGSAVSEDDRSGIAKPDIAEWRLQHIRERRRPSSDLGAWRIRGDQPDLFAAAAGMNGAGESDHFVTGGLEIVFPQILVAGEADPDILMRRPFRRLPCAHLFANVPRAIDRGWRGIRRPHTSSARHPHPPARARSRNRSGDPGSLRSSPS